VGREVSDGCGCLAPGLRQGDPVLCVSRPNPTGGLHHQRHRECNARLRKIITTRGHFPSGDTATKLIWLTLRNIAADWGRAAKDWKKAMNQFSTLYAERFQTARG
jgi:hypothetical protein